MFCWTLLKTYLNGRKIPSISLLFQDKKVFADLNESSEIFNSFIAKQCSLTDNGSTLPSFFLLQTNHTWMLTSR